MSPYHTNGKLKKLNTCGFHMNESVKRFVCCGKMCRFSSFSTSPPKTIRMAFEWLPIFLFSFVIDNTWLKPKPKKKKKKKKIPIVKYTWKVKNDRRWRRRKIAITCNTFCSSVFTFRSVKWSMTQVLLHKFTEYLYQIVKCRIYDGIKKSQHVALCLQHVQLNSACTVQCIETAFGVWMVAKMSAILHFFYSYTDTCSSRWSVWLWNAALIWLKALSYIYIASLDPLPKCNAKRIRTLEREIVWK